jgi:MFS family permease
VFLLFFASGAAVGAWTSRIPTIKHHLHLTDGQLSIALLALALGGLTAMRYTGRFVDRYGSTTVLAPAALLLGPVLVLPGYAPNLATLVATLLCFGAIHGALNVAMNANAVECQRAYHRPIMAGFHALFSIGGFAGAATGGLFARAQFSPATTFITVGAVIAVLAVWAGRAAMVSPHEPQSTNVQTVGGPIAPTIRRSRREYRVLLLGVVAFCALTCEGAAADWSSVCMLDSLRSSTATAAAAYAVFSLAMTAGRLTGDRLVAVLGPVRLLRGCGLVATVGFAAGLLSGRPALAIAGFAALGAGLSCVVPQTYSTAGNLNAAEAGRGLSRVASLGYLGFVCGPVLIGTLATYTSVANAMLLLPVLTSVVALTANIVRPPALRPGPPAPALQPSTSSLVAARP